MTNVPRQGELYLFKGFVAFYGLHYYCYLRDFGEDLWRLCDD